MTQSLVEMYNTDPATEELRTALGHHVLEVDAEHAVYEMRETTLNKMSGYWVGFALQALVEGTIGGFSNAAASAERGAISIEWVTVHVSTSFLSNSRGDTVQAEAHWDARSDSEAVITTRVRSGDRVLVHATSTHRKR